MKVTFVTRENFEMPAVRVRCYGFAEKLKKSGIETEVFSYADHLGAKSGKEEGRMRTVDKVYYNFKALKHLLPKKSILFLQRFNYHSYAPFFLRFLKNWKLIFDVDDWEAREDIKYYFGRIPSSKAELAMRIVAKNSHLCIGASKFLTNFLSKYNQNVLYIPTGVDADIFKPNGSNKEGTGIVLSWLGTIHRQDNVENLKFLIECFQELCLVYDNIRLEIMGDGIYYNQLRGIIQGAGNLKVKLRPWRSPEFIPGYLNNIDIGVMPLIQNTKFNQAKSPTRIFEYMAMEKPIVTSATGELPYIIENGVSGFLAKEKSDFIVKLKCLINDEDLRRKLGKNARKTIIENYSLNILSNRLVEAIKKL